jgi:PadR family transcriptional regulator PadR
VNPVVGNKIMRDVLLAFVRIHILHHAAEGRIFGVEMMEELKRHGYDITPGTLYPILHALEETGILTSTHELVDGKGRRYYRTTKVGDALLKEVRGKIRELVHEVMQPRSHVKRRKAGSR